MVSEDKLNIVLDGKIVSGYRNETILQLAKRNGIEIPTLCNDERLEPYSSCFLCVVEIEGMRGLQPACSTKIVEGMKIITTNDKIRKSRKSSLELLLSNHYADCLAPCKMTCPAGVDVQGYIALINKGMYKEAVGLIKETNPLPAICGRVCVRPCEVACRRNLLEGTGVGIDYLKRYTTDKDFNSGDKFKPDVKYRTGKKVAIIGAGPGGLTSAYYLAIEGHSVDIYEALPYAGGMLRYGIPPYRLPNDIIDKEVESITELGVNIFYEKKLGVNLSYKEIKTKYDSVILTIGSQNGTNIGCENDKAENVLSGIDFLRNMELTGQKYDFTGKKVAVLGGGNTAMDCCRTSLRCGAEKVYIIYRRTEKEMPANPIEIHESKLEGIEYLFLTAPAKVNIDEKGKLKSLSCFKMQLGEPDASGRRRPMKVEGSEFEIELDYILAAIGQKTNVNFIDDINNNSDERLVINKWGDIDADKNTLRTSIKNVFAAGDGVTGPATLIEAIAQGRRAALSCHQYLTGATLTGKIFEFVSRKDNFEKQKPEQYRNKFRLLIREEMPTLEPSARKNFTEVELGYSDNSALQETFRCLECGCAENFTCVLKRYCTEYNVNQNKFSGEYKKYEIDFEHPFIEIDNNKCILCSRCVRICKDVVNANALGLINRGFETFVAPSMKQTLLETDCESCGMCISTCPTGAMSENYKYKPGPFNTESFDTICNYCSVGCEITIHHKNNYITKITGKNGIVNNDTNICRYAKFGYSYLNDNNRITAPLQKKDGKFVPISFEKAYDLIYSKIRNSASDKNIFFAGARLTNEELYLIQKFARAAVKTNNVSSFHYLGRGEQYRYNSLKNTPFEQIEKAGRIYVIGSEINYDHPVMSYMINNARFKNNTGFELVTSNSESSLIKKANRALIIKSYYYFLKTINHYILSSNLENSLFIKDNVTGFDEYKKSLLFEDFNILMKKSGVFFEKRLIDFANDLVNEMNSIIIFSEKNISSNAGKELFNLALITGKLGKNYNGLISLKEKNNSQGLFDMGIEPGYGVGGNSIESMEFLNDMKKLWHIDKLPETISDIIEILKNKNFKNIFIYGEDPIGTSITPDETRELINGKDFMVVQDYFITETAKEADLILPASLPFEIGGSFANTQKYILNFDPAKESKLIKNSYQQLIDLMKMFGITNKVNITNNITIEIASLLRENISEDVDLKLNYTKEDSDNRKFNYGCDYVVKRFEEEFNSLIKK
jgi:formate dehydrogenase major subunit